MEMLLIKKEKKSVTDECPSSMANEFKLSNSPWHFLRAQRHSLGDKTMWEIPSAVRGGRKAADQTAAPEYCRAQGTTRRRPSGQHAFGQLVGGRGTVFYSASLTALEDCGRPPSYSQCVVILQEPSVLASGLACPRLGGEDIAIKLGEDGRWRRRFSRVTAAAGQNPFTLY